MKQTPRNIIKAIAGVSALLTLCGTTAVADPLNAAFLQVDIDGGNPPGSGPTQAGFLSIPVPTQTSTNFGLVITTNFPPSAFINANSGTPSGTVTVTIVATNDEVGIPSGFQFPTWVAGVSTSPNGIDRGTETNGNAWGNLYEDFLSVSHDTYGGWGDDQIWLTVSNLLPNTNYEITVWDFDQIVNETVDYAVAWGPQNPDPYGSNTFQPGSDTLPRYARVKCGGPEPTSEYQYSGSFFVTSDTNGQVTVYGWLDSSTYGTLQWVPFNGFAIGAPPVISNLTNITITSITANNGTNIVLNWTFTGGNNPEQTFSVCRTNLLTAPTATWPVIATALHGTYYTDTNATDANNFYIISSP